MSTKLVRIRDDWDLLRGEQGYVNMEAITLTYLHQGGPLRVLRISENKEEVEVLPQDGGEPVWIPIRYTTDV